MYFSDFRATEITNVLRHTPSIESWRVQNRETHIIGIQLCGVMHHEIAGRNITLTENSLFFFNRDEDFSAAVGELGESYTIHFKTAEPIRTQSFAVRAQNVTDVISLLSKLEQLHKLHRADGHLAMSYFHRFCALIEEPSKKAYHKSDARMESAREYVDLHFGESGVLGAAVLLSGLSRRRFNTLFRVHYGATPNGYLVGVRIENAKRLLTEGSISVNRAAEMTGFGDVYYFSKVFKEKTGLSPTEYAKNGGREN